MTNHYHLLFEIPEPERISSIMAGMQRLYTVYYHKRYGTSGFLWQGRFGSKPIQKDSYLQRCGAYIELNPVRSGITKEAGEYKYTSAGYYVSNNEDPIITEDPLYVNLGETKQKRRERYRELLENIANEKDPGNNWPDSPVGNNDFRRRLVKNNGRWVPRRKGRSKASFVFNL
jgi:putative transposase